MIRRAAPKTAARGTPNDRIAAEAVHRGRTSYDRSQPFTVIHGALKVSSAEALAGFGLPIG